MWEGDAGSIHNGLGQSVVPCLQSVGRSLECIPDLLASLEGWRRVPELIALAAQLALRQGVVTLPLGFLRLQGLVSAYGNFEQIKNELERMKIGK